MSFNISRVAILLFLFLVSARAADMAPTLEELARAEQRIDAQLPYLVRKRDAKPGEVELGAKLFFDPRLSSVGTMSCATCHQPSQTMTDGLPRAVGLGHKVLKRNTPSLTGGRYRKFFFWDGRARSIEEAALTALQNPEEMNQTLAGLERALASRKGYVEAFARVYGPGGPTHARAASALAAFVESLVTFDSAFDRFHESGVPMEPAARRGLVLFTGKAGCVRCHASSNFSSENFYALGLPGDDPGRFAATGRESDRRAFRVPSLRNAALTAPYMHDGSLKTLADVVEFFDRGGPGLDRLGLEKGEKEDLVAFLEALSSPPGPITPSRIPLDSEPALRAGTEAVSTGADETAALAEWDRVARSIERRVAERERTSSWSRRLPPSKGGSCPESMDALLRGAVEQRWREKDPEFFDGVFLPMARRHYVYLAVADANPARCAPLAAFTSGPEAGTTSESACREVYYEMRFGQALGELGLKGPGACEESLSHQTTLGPADARELCAVLLARRDDPAKACALFQPKYLDRHQVLACENGMRIYTGDLRTCGNVADLAEHLTDRCEVYPLFRAASRAGDIERCGGSERCRVLMGAGRKAAAGVERSLTARACGRAAEPRAGEDAELRQELERARGLLERISAARRTARAERLSSMSARVP